MCYENMSECFWYFGFVIKMKILTNFGMIMLFFCDRCLQAEKLMEKMFLCHKLCISVIKNQTLL